MSTEDYPRSTGYALSKYYEKYTTQLNTAPNPQQSRLAAGGPREEHERRNKPSDGSTVGRRCIRCPLILFTVALLDVAQIESPIIDLWMGIWFNPRG